MTRKLSIKRAACSAGVAAVLALGLAACGGSSNNAPTTAVTVAAPPPKLEDTFGTNFGIAFRNDNNTEPTHPATGDINPVDPTKEPTALHS